MNRSDRSSNDSVEGRNSLDDEKLDPRIQGELESLNSASAEINIYETELEKASSKFQSLRTESMQRLNNLQKKLGKCVTKARPYFELRKQLEQIQIDVSKSAQNYQRANGAYRAAKETVAAAEERMLNAMKEKADFDSTWQEMLNNAITLFTESEKERKKSEAEHLQMTAECTAITQQIHSKEKELPKTILKARPYFDLKDQLEHKLEQQKWNVEDLQRALGLSKEKYRVALQALECISEDLHYRRQIKLLPRTPGVGAEKPDDQQITFDLSTVLPEPTKDTSSVISLDDTLDDDSSSSYGNKWPELRLSHDIGDGASISSELNEEDQKSGVSDLAPTKDLEGLTITDKTPNPGRIVRFNLGGNVGSAEKISVADGVKRFGNIDGAKTCQNVAEKFGGEDDSSIGTELSVDSDCAKETSSRPKSNRRQGISSRKSFPILVGLSETSKRYSPKLPRAKISKVYEQVVIQDAGETVVFPKIAGNAGNDHSPLAQRRSYSPLSRSYSPSMGNNSPRSYSPMRDGYRRDSYHTYSPLTGSPVLTHVRKPIVTNQGVGVSIDDGERMFDGGCGKQMTVGKAE